MLGINVIKGKVNTVIIVINFFLPFLMIVFVCLLLFTVWNCPIILFLLKMKELFVLF